MGDEIIGKFAVGVNRRSFLRGSALAAAAFGISAVSAGISLGQEPQPSGGAQQGDNKNESERKDEDKKNDDKQNADKQSEDKQGDKSPDPPIDKTTYLGDDGRSYRICPVCGSNMYQQDHTWTCENCGFTYTE